MLEIFGSSIQRDKDERELWRLFDKCGNETVSVLRNRSQDKSISLRDRRHWKRLVRRARPLACDYL